MSDLTHLREVLEPFQRQMCYGVGSIVLFTLYMFITDLLRVIKYTAFKCGYKSGRGKGALPGPMEDTRVTRFSSGPRIIPEYRQKYGPIYRVFCGAIPEVVLTDPEDIKVYYQGDAKLHYKEPNIGFGDYMGKVLGHSVGAKDGEAWHRMRSCVDPHFSLEHSFELLPVMISDTEEWLEQLPSLPVAKKDEKGRLHIKAEELVSELPFKMIARRLFGDLIDDQFGAELYAMNEVHERIIGHTFFSKLLQYKIFHYLPIQANRDIDAFSKDWSALLVRKSLECEKRGITSAVYELYKNMKAGQLTFKEFTHTVDEILFTNIDVTTTSISWATSQVAMNPDVQNRLLAEIRAAMNDKSLGETRAERRDAYIRKTNTLLHFCYLESGRLRPVLFYALPEITHDPKIINGYYIPPKTSILIDAYTLNRTAPIWGEDGHSFRPDRFQNLPATQYRYSFWRFGIGPRKCVGQNFGDKIVKIVLSAIIENYSVELKDNYLSEDPTKFVHAPSGSLILTLREA